MTIDFSTDFSVVDGLQSAELTNRDGGDPVSVQVLKRWMTTAEADVSNGAYTTDDVVFHLSGVGLAIEAGIGDRITHDDTVWTVLAVRHETLTNRREFIARRLQALNSTITIEVATWTRNEDGMQEAVWSAEVENLPAVFQPLQSTDGKHYDRQHQKMVYVAYLAETRDVANRRVIHDGTTYRIIGSTRPNDLSQLFRLELEPWPAAA